jgi:protein arginine N-methyltransferase 5
MDNLDSVTYQVFETDPIKYQQYELAVEQALTDMQPRTSDEAYFC